MQRYTLSFTCAGAVVTDSGDRPAYGAVRQINWYPVNAHGLPTQDTGPAPIGTLTLFSVPTKETDTGLGIMVMNEASLVLGNEVSRAPRQLVRLLTGVVPDTGVDFVEPFYVSGHTFKGRLTPADTGSVTGRLEILLSETHPS